jgi:hypothetical protein
MSTNGKNNPVARIRLLHENGANIGTLAGVMNANYAVTTYGSKTVVACLDGNGLNFFSDQDFHKMFSNVTVQQEIKKKDGTTTMRFIKLSKYWFDWDGRRQFLGRGVVFEPGGPPHVQGDMLNIWQGYGVEPQQGDWSLMRPHILNVVCSGNQNHFEYLMGLMAWGVQHLDKPLGVAVALLGPQGAGKGILARTYGGLYGKHFSHITNGDQLTGHFNASIGTACAVFLDEAVWANDKKGEGTLKALITEPTFQLEAKFRDPITVENRLRIMIASNSDWAVPAGIGDRRWFVLNVADTYAGTKNPGYWKALYDQLENGGRAAMLFDLLSMDLKGFDVRAIPHTAAKARQQTYSLKGSMAWLHDVLQEGSINSEEWQGAGLTTDKDQAYACYVEFSKRQRDWRPAIKSVWSKDIQAALGPLIGETRPTKGNKRVRLFQFGPLADCRQRFMSHLGAPDLEWQAETHQNKQSEEVPGREREDDRIDLPDDEWEPESDPELEYETESEPD